MLPVKTAVEKYFPADPFIFVNSAVKEGKCWPRSRARDEARQVNESDIPPATWKMWWFIFSHDKACKDTSIADLPFLFPLIFLDLPAWKQRVEEP